MGGYAKVFDDIVDSSLWMEPSDTCKVFITLLVLADRDGYVRGSEGWLACKAHISLEACKKALETLKSPDPASRTPDNDGRRVEQLEDGWLILNYISFRDRLSCSKTATSTRERVRIHRERYKSLQLLQPVTGKNTAVADADVSESFFKKGEWGENASLREAWAEWVKYRMDMKVKKPKHWADFFRRQAAWLEDTYSPEVCCVILKKSMRNGWQGLFPPDPRDIEEARVHAEPRKLKSDPRVTGAVAQAPRQLKTDPRVTEGRRENT